MVLPTSLKAAAASDVRSTPTSVPQVAYRDPIDDSSVVSGRLPESVPSPDDSSELLDPPITTMQELLDTIQNTLTLNRRRVDEEIAASARASLEAVDALSARFETLFHNNVTQRHRLQHRSLFGIFKSNPCLASISKMPSLPHPSDLTMKHQELRFLVLLSLAIFDRLLQAPGRVHPHLVLRILILDLVITALIISVLV